MRPSLHTRLLNGPFGDPVAHVRLEHRREALLFDLGELTALSPREMLRIEAAFVSHTHMDHFSGFDDLLRVVLGRGKDLLLFGPTGLVDQVGHRLASYTWNLVENYPEPFAVVVREVGPGAPKAAAFDLHTGFARRALAPPVFDGETIFEAPGFSVRAIVLEHLDIPVVAYRLDEARHVNVHRPRLDEAGLATGPWLGRVKRAMFEGAPAATEIAAKTADGGERTLTLGAIARDFLSVEPGQSIGFVTDVSPTPDNEARLIAFLTGLDTLVMEACFLEKDAELGRRKGHMTAAATARIATAIGARKLVPSHFSPRYEHQWPEAVAELQASFSGAISIPARAW